MTAPARHLRATITLIAATIAFALALGLRTRVDPWRATAVAASIGILLSTWTLRDRQLFAVTLRGVVAAIALGVGLVLATHGVFQVLATASPAFARTVDDLYASIEVGSSRVVLLALTTVVVIAEELVWRGVAVEWFANGRSRFSTGAWCVASYALPQVASGAPLLVAAAIGLGAVLGVQRIVTGRLTDSLITHLIWSTSIFVLLPLT